MTCAFEQKNDQFVACGGLDNLCTIYKLNDGEDAINRAHRELTGHDGYLSCCHFVGPEKIVTASGDSTAMLWDIETGASLAKFEGHDQDVMSVSVLPNINPCIFVTGSCDATAKVWDSRSPNACTMTLTGHNNDINATSFFPDGNAFATGSDDSTVRLFDIRAAAEMATFQSESILCGVTSVSVSNSGRYIFGGYDDYNCYKWDTLGASGKPSQQLMGHENRVSCVSVNPVGNALCTGSWDATLRIWA
jgi:guanine nucleotide-binding protein G(I)/G(S)/G(T) subunit beta-1